MQQPITITCTLKALPGDPCLVRNIRCKYPDWVTGTVEQVLIGVDSEGNLDPVYRVKLRRLKCRLHVGQESIQPVASVQVMEGHKA